MMQPPNLVVSGTPEVGLAFRHDSFVVANYSACAKRGFYPLPDRNLLCFALHISTQSVLHPRRGTK